MFRLIFALLMTVSLAACVTTKPDPAAFATAEEAIAAAERAGDAELAPMELRFAREKLDAARRGMDSKQFDIAYWLIEESEMAQRRADWKAPPLKATRGTLFKYIKNVKSASEGCVTDE